MPVDFILASSSPRRVEILAQIGIIAHKVIAADIDETPHKAELPKQLALRLSREKALAIAAQNPGTVILGADTVVALGRRILPKAENRKSAAHCLELLSGRRHRVYGGLAIIDKEGQCRQRLVETRVKFKRLGHDEKDFYLSSEEWKGKAGGYAIQGLAATFISWISGSYGNVVGLCPYATSLLLKTGQKMADSEHKTRR